MARPITWTDVAYRGNAAAIEMFGRAADRIAGAVKGVGDVAVDMNEQAVAANTDAAIASILNSADPQAAAAAVPKTWQFDPLQISKAANAREGQLQQAKAVEQNILASQAQVRQSDSAVETQKAQRQDIEDKRLGAELAQPYLNQILSGKFKGVNPEDFADKGQGGIYAQEAIQKALQEQRDFSLRQRESNARTQAIMDQKRAENYLGWAREFGASAEGQKLDPAELDRRLVARAKELGLPATLADTAALTFQKGAQANMPTEAELDSVIPGSGGKTYRQALGTISQVQSQVQSQKAEELSKPYDGKQDSPSILQLQEFASRAPAFQEGSLSFVAGELAAKAVDMDQIEARERIAKIQAKHRHLSYAQAADLALQSEDRWNTWLNNPATAPEVEAGAQMYKLVDTLGRKEGIDRLASEKTYKFDKRLSELPTTARQLSGSARTGTAPPVKILEWDAEISKATAAQAAEQAREAAARAEAELARARENQKRQEQLLYRR